MGVTATWTIADYLLAATAATAVVSTVATVANAGKTPQVQAPKAPPQASKTPDAMGVLKQQQGAGQAGGAPGVAQTFLTGAGGIDPALLQLGRTTLLGG